MRDISILSRGIQIKYRVIIKIKQKKDNKYKLNISKADIRVSYTADSYTEIAARQEAFLDGMGQMFEDHGYGKAEVDHDYTEEELKALAKAIQVEG